MTTDEVRVENRKISFYMLTRFCIQHYIKTPLDCFSSTRKKLYRVQPFDFEEHFSDFVPQFFTVRTSRPVNNRFDLPLEIPRCGSRKGRLLLTRVKSQCYVSTSPFLWMQPGFEVAESNLSCTCSGKKN